MFKKSNKRGFEEKFINIDAGAEGNLKFNSPVNIRINGKFEGELEARGNLAIGENGNVKVRILRGEYITIEGKVSGDIESSKRLELLPTASVIGNIKTPTLVVNEGATLKGNCQMPVDEEKNIPKESSKKKK